VEEDLQAQHTHKGKLKIKNGKYLLILFSTILFSTFFYGGITKEGILILLLPLSIFLFFFSFKIEKLYILIFFFIPLIFSKQFDIVLSSALPFILGIFFLSYSNSFKISIKNWVHTARIIPIITFIYIFLLSFGFLKKYPNFYKINYPTFGFIVNWNHQVTLFNLLFFINLGIFFSNLRKFKGIKKKELEKYKNHLFLTFFSILALIFLTLYIFLIPSTGGILSFIFGIFFYSILHSRINKKRIFVFLFTIFLIEFVHLFQYDIFFLSPFHQDDPKSIYWRVKVWKETLEGISKNPILGYGFGMFPYSFNKLKDNIKIWWTHSENDYLTFLYEGGVFSLCILLILFYFLYNSLKEFKKNDFHPIVKYTWYGFFTSIFVALFHSTADSPLHTPSVLLLFFFSISYIGLTKKEKEGSSIFPIRILISSILIFFIIYYSPFYKYQLWYERVSNQEIQELSKLKKDLDFLCKRYDKTFLFYFWRGIIEEKISKKNNEENLLSLALMDFEKSFKLYPKFYEALYRSYFIEKEISPKKAEETLNNLIKMFPRRPEGYLIKIRDSLEKGKVNEAEKLLKDFKENFKNFPKNQLEDFLYDLPIVPILK